MNLDLPCADTKIKPVIVQQTLDESAVGRSRDREELLQAIDSEVLRSYLSLAVVLGLERDRDRSRYCSHAQILVGVVMCISAYPLLGVYYLTTHCYKRMRLLTRFYHRLRIRDWKLKKFLTFSRPRAGCDGSW